MLMSLGAALRRFEPDPGQDVFEEVRTAVETTVGREDVSRPDQSVERMRRLGFVVLSNLAEGLDRTIPPQFSPEQRTAFSRATRLSMDTLTELTTGGRNRNSALGSELIYLSQTRSLPETVTEVIKSTVRSQLEEDHPGESIVAAASRFPVLLTISSEIDLHHIGSGSPDERDGFQRGLFNTILAVDALATQQENQ